MSKVIQGTAALSCAILLGASLAACGSSGSATTTVTEQQQNQNQDQNQNQNQNDDQNQNQDQNQSAAERKKECLKYANDPRDCENIP